MSKNFIVPLVIYPFDVMVSMGESDEVLFKKLRSTVDENDLHIAQYKDDNCKARAVLFTSNQPLIRMKNIPKTNKDYGDLQHEILHLTCFIMDRIGMELVVTKSCEAYAYLVGYLTEKIYDKCVKFHTSVCIAQPLHKQQQ